MSEPAEIHVRVTRLEEKMGEVHYLASAASNEVADVHARLRGHTKSLEALRETQVEQGEDIKRLERKVDEGFAKVDENFAKVDENFAKVDDRFAKVDDRFDELEAKVDDGFTKLNLGQAQITALLNIAIGRPDEGDTDR